MAEGAGKVPPTAQTPGWRQTLMRRGALAIGASAMPGAVNYAIVLGLTFFLSPAATGEYRLLFSYFALANLLCVYESNKLYVRAAALADSSAMTSVFLNQALIGAALFALTLVATALDHVIGWRIAPEELPVVALFSALYMPATAYLAVLQGQGRFLTLFVTEAAKYATALLTFAGVLAATTDVTRAMYAQFAMMVAWSIALFVIFVARRVDLSGLLRAPLSFLRATPAAEARLLSLGVILPGMLEHADKIVLGASHGLAAVGVYTLGFSTGRLIYNTLKPATAIFYSRFAIAMPTSRQLRRIAFAFTALGIALSVILIAFYPAAPSELRIAFPVTGILFLSYGLAMWDAVFTQAYSINPLKNSRHIFIANAAGSLVCTPLFVLAPFTDAQTAIILLALHYPVRHTATVLILHYLDRRTVKQSSG